MKSWVSFSTNSCRVRLYTQITIETPGSSTSCVQQDPTTSTFRLSANVTDQLTTCQPWGLTAIDGTPPYTIYLTAVSSDTVTIVDMDVTDNTLIYTNRVEPNTMVIGMLVHIYFAKCQILTSSDSLSPGLVSYLRSTL